MTLGFFNGKVLRGLAVRVLFFLSLALLPIGLIAISQTQQIAAQNRLNAELSLIAVTEQASLTERTIFQAGLSAADALGSIIGLRQENAEDCSRFFSDYLKSNPIYGLAGFIGMDGIMTCSTAETVFDFAQDPTFQAAVANPRWTARTLDTGAISRRPVTVVNAPAFDDDGLAGFVALSIPAQAFDSEDEPTLPVKPLAMMTFNQDGEILTSERAYDKARVEVPSDVALKVFVGQKAQVFRAKNTEGANRIYAVQPLVSGAVYALTVWPIDMPFMNASLVNRLGALLPITMWAASLIVAFWALNRLAIRHIRKLGRQMRRFALNRNLPRSTLGHGVPTELVEIEAAFMNMGESILRDEATLEDSLREKNILLKEVHHRVKNNLQLISSIMNMQIRQAKTDDARRVLQRLQERILGLATVHKNLYQNDDLVRVDAATLLHEVVNQLLSVGLAPGSNVKVTQEYAPITIDADDAAPLTLLVSEAMTNALKHVAQDKGSQSRISVELSVEPPDHARLVLTNTTGVEPEQEGTGLGSRLIDAFARQLNGQTTVTETDDSYRLEILFPVPRYSKQVYDY